MKSVLNTQRKRWFVLVAAAACAIGAVAEMPNDQKARATTALEQAVKSDPNNAELWVHLGFAYRKLGQINQAQSAFEKASSIDSQNQDALFMLGLIYESKHQKQDALRVWKQYESASTDPEKRAVAENHIRVLSQ